MDSLSDLDPHVGSARQWIAFQKQQRMGVCHTGIVSSQEDGIRSSTRRYYYTDSMPHLHTHVESSGIHLPRHTASVLD